MFRCHVCDMGFKEARIYLICFCIDHPAVESAILYGVVIDLSWKFRLGISWRISAPYRLLTSSKKDKEYGKPASAKKTALITGQHYHSCTFQVPVPYQSQSRWVFLQVPGSKHQRNRSAKWSRRAKHLADYANIFLRYGLGKHQQMSLITAHGSISKRRKIPYVYVYVCIIYIYI